jgi:hypothetical protein
VNNYACENEKIKIYSVYIEIMASYMNIDSNGKSEAKANGMNKTMKGDLEFNELSYTAPQNLSLRVNKTHRQNKADRTSYGPSETCLIRLNGGSDFIDPRGSYLRFGIAVDSGNAHFGNGSALNLINQVVIRSKSGVEVDRFRRVNLYQKMAIKFEHSRDYVRKLGTLMGYGGIDVTGTGANIDELSTNPALAGVTTTAITYVIPLKFLSGFFNPMGSPLIPSQLASGLEIELTFESLTRAMVQNSGTSTTYTITNPEIHTESVRLTDQTQRALNMESASNGLNYIYKRYFTSEIAGNATSLTHRATISVGQCTRFLATIVNGTAALATDNFDAITADYSSVIARVGQLYFPSTTLQTDAASRELLLHAYKSFGKLHYDSHPSSVSQLDFTSGGFCCVSMDLTKDMSQIMGGIPVNSSRIAELQVERTTSNASDSQVLFLEYVSQAKIYLDNVVIGV